MDEDMDDYDINPTLGRCPRCNGSIYEVSSGDYCPKCDILNAGNGWRPAPRIHLSWAGTRGGTRCGYNAPEDRRDADIKYVTCKRCLSLGITSHPGHGVTGGDSNGTS